jgi:hypothetical protein
VNCPACGKSNTEISATECVRCGCDLGRLQTLLRCAARHLSEARKRVQGHDWQEALREAEQSWRFHHSSDAARLAFAAAAALGRTQPAVLWHARFRRRE